MNIRWLYSHRVLVALLVAATLAVGLMTVLVIRQQQNQPDGQVHLEAGGSVGANPFVPLVVPPSATDGNPGGESTSFQTAASTDNRTTCDPEKLISYFTSNQQASEAWVRALNYDRTLSWGGGSRIEPQQIPVYIRELTPRLLAEDLRVTNYQFTNGVALPVQSVLEKGTAVLVDAKGIARVRCVCGNPLTPMVQPKMPPIYQGTPWPSFQPQRVAMTQHAPQCGNDEFYDGGRCQRRPACPHPEFLGDDGRCHGSGEPSRSDNARPPEMQQWQDRPGPLAESRYPEEPGPPVHGRYSDELSPRDDIRHPNTPVRPDEPVYPARSRHPDDSVQSDKPVQPDEQRHPDKLTQPADQENPVKAEHPGASRHPVSPVPSDKDNQPDKDQHLGKGRQPNKPKRPDTSVQPDTPVQPRHPAQQEDKPAQPR
jgi:hypothetical protein